MSIAANALGAILIVQASSRFDGGRSSKGTAGKETDCHEDLQAKKDRAMARAEREAIIKAERSEMERFQRPKTLETKALKTRGAQSTFGTWPQAHGSGRSVNASNMTFNNCTINFGP
jgi:hypothetical protein